MDYYEILGVNRNSSPEEIKSAYRKLAMKHHPDRGGDEAEFKKISEAYDAITNPNKQQHNATESGFNWNNESADFGDVFTHFFNQHRQHSYANRNPDGITDITITLEQAYNGTDVVIDVGYTREVIYINPGVRSGTKLRIKGKGPARYKDMTPGDLVVRVFVEAPSNMAVDGIDLFQRFDINAIDAMIGTEIDLLHVSGKLLRLTVPAGTQNGSKLRMKNLGMPDSTTRKYGDFYAIISVNIPKITDENDVETLNKINNKIGKN